MVIAQIEDPEAIEAVEAIAAVSGLDALFVGRVDLTVAYGAETQDDPRVVAAVERVCAAGVSTGKPVGMFLARVEETAYWQSRGRIPVFAWLGPRLLTCRGKTNSCVG